MAQFRYRPEIDGLRAIAVLLVLIYHYFPSKLTGGFVGVDVFFVISGYLISSIILSDINSGSFSYATFYSRRIRRIFPALITVLVATLVAGVVILLPDELNDLCRQVAASVLFSANILFWHDSGYFDTNSELKPLLHIWSLGVEEQFYILWPLCLMLIIRLKKFRLHVIGAIALVSFLCAELMVRDYPIATFYLPLSRFWELMIGAALAITGAKSDALLRSRIANEAFVTLGLSMIVISAVVIGPQTPFPGLAALPPTIGTALIIAGDENCWPNKIVLSFRPIVFVGLISYPLYLWHWPLLALYKTGTMSISPSVSARFILIACAASLAVATYYLIEWPIRINKKPIVIRYLAAVMAGTGIVSVTISIVFAGLLDHSRFNTRQLAWAYAENVQCNAKHPFDHKLGWWFCMTNSERPPTLIILGDSHANQLYPGLVSQPELGNESILSIGACNDAEGIHSAADDAGEDPCAGKSRDEQDSFIRDIVVHNPSIRRAILASMWARFDANGNEVDFWLGTPTIGGLSSVIPGEQSLSAAQMYRNGLDRRITFLESRGISVALVMPFPHLPYDVRRCINRPFHQATANCIVPIQDEVRAAASFRIIANWLKHRHASMVVYDPIPAFCDSRVCRFFENGEFFLRDQHHLSALGSQRVGKDFVARIWQTWSTPRH